MTSQSRVLVDYGAGGSVFDLEPQEILELFERLAQQQQWSNRESSRGSKGRYEVDEVALLKAKMEALQLQVDKQKATMKAAQSLECSLCGDESHDYDHCPLRQPEEEEHVHSINNEPSYFPKPPFTRSYSNDPKDRQYWRERPDRPAFGTTNNNSVPRYQNQQGQGYGNRNFYNNAQFQNRNPQPNTAYRPPYMRQEPELKPSEVNNFMHEQGKMNQMLFEQMQAINEKLARMAGGDAGAGTSSRGVTQLPSQPTNPNAEVKVVHTLRSGTQYADPPMPE